MPDRNTVEIIIKAATDKATAEVKRLVEQTKHGFDDMAKGTESAGARMKQAWSAAKAAWLEIIAVGYTFKKVWDFAYDAAMFRERQQAFHNMAASMGADGKALLEDLKRLSRGTISEFKLMEKAGTAMSMDIPAERLKGLMEIARATAKVTGQTVEQAFSDISLGVARQSKMILDNLGIMVNIEKANTKYAEAMKIVGRELTDIERKQAFLNATMEAGEEIVKRVGAETTSAAEAMQRYLARMEDTKKIVGNVFLSMAMGWQGLFVAVGAGFNDLFAILQNWYSNLLSVCASLPSVFGKFFGDAAKQARGWAEQSALAAKEGWDQLEDIGNVITSLWSEVGATASAAGKSQKDAAEAAAAAAKKAKDALTALLDKEKEALALRRQATEEIYKETGIGAEAAAALEIQKLTEKAATWEAAGVDILNLNEYLYERIGKLAEEAWEKGEADLADYYDTVQAKSKFLVQEFQQTQADVMARLGAVDQSLEKYRSIFIEDRASDSLNRIKGLLDSIRDKTVHVNVVYGAGGGAGATGLAAEIPKWEEKWGIKIGDVESTIAENMKYGLSPIE